MLANSRLFLSLSLVHPATNRGGTGIYNLANVRAAEAMFCNHMDDLELEKLGLQLRRCLTIYTHRETDYLPRGLGSLHHYSITVKKIPETLEFFECWLKLGIQAISRTGYCRKPH